MAIGPLDPESTPTPGQPAGDPARDERDEHDDLVRRCDAAEQQVAALTAELEEARARLAELESEAPFLLFRDHEDPSVPGLSSDGSDPRIVSVALGATSIVAALVALLALANGNLFTAFGLGMVVLALGLAFAAARTRVQPVEVTVTRGIVHIQRGESSFRFDLRTDATRVEQLGRPGDSGWQVRFLRRNMDPFVVDAGMVDPASFVAQLREWRPSL